MKKQRELSTPATLVLLPISAMLLLLVFRQVCHNLWGILAVLPLSLLAGHLWGCLLVKLLSPLENYLNKHKQP